VCRPAFVDSKGKALFLSAAERCSLEEDPSTILGGERPSAILLVLDHLKEE
jgi:hypothetical protein